MKRTSLSLIFAMVACGVGKVDPAEDFSDLATADEKSDAFSNRLKLLGSLDYGQTSAEVKYTQKPRFRGFKFAGQKGDKVTVDVRSTDGGDAVAWVVNNAYEVLAFNDDISRHNVDSHITVTLPGNANPDIVTYLVIFRDYYLSTGKFQVELNGVPVAPDYYSCMLDGDCTLTPAQCCTNLGNVAVRVGQEAAYRNALNCPQIQACPKIALIERHVAQCNNTSHKCEAVLPEDIACGGRVANGNAHDCPGGWTCYGTKRLVDGTDVCVQQCGGIAARQCDVLNTACQDNPNDSCDPNQGGADCGGLCLASQPQDCRTTGCGANSYCSFCFAHWACLPNGALC